jgi:hypothetical protein
MGYKRPKINEEAMANNPLVSTGFKVEVIKMHRSLMTDKGVVNDYFDFEAEPLVRMYVKAEYRNAYAKLSGKAKILFGWIIYELDYGKDWLWINKKRYMKECDVSLNTYKPAVNELCVSLFLAKSIYMDVYFINPRIFFSGSRPKKYPDNVVIKDESADAITIKPKQI